MPIDLAEARTWDAGRLLEEYEARIAAVRNLRGNVGVDAFRVDASRIGHLCEEKYRCHPEALVELGLVMRTVTSPDGLTHDFRGRRECGSPHFIWDHDKPTRVVTCILCAARCR